MPVAGGIEWGRELAAPVCEKQFRISSSVETAQLGTSSGSSVRMLRWVSEEKGGPVAQPEGVVAGCVARKLRERGTESFGVL